MRYWIPEGGLFPKSYVIGIQANGLMTASQHLLLHPLPFNILWTPSDPGNQVYAHNPPSNNWEAVFYLLNPTNQALEEVATLNIPSSETTGSFETSGNFETTIPIPRGQCLLLQAPDPADTTLGNLAITLLAQRE